jgi:hypothetical protein
MLGRRATVLLFVGVSLAATTTQGCLDYDDDDPERWPAKPVSNWDIESARVFQEHPLYWLGASYAGLPMTLMRSEIPRPQYDFPRYPGIWYDHPKNVLLSYGELGLTSPDPASASWNAPLEISIFAYCDNPPEKVLPRAHLDYMDDYEEYLSEEDIAEIQYFHDIYDKYGVEEVAEGQLHGVDSYLIRYSEDEAFLFLWTGGSFIALETWSTDLDIVQAAEDLIPIGEEFGTSDVPFPPPETTGC